MALWLDKYGVNIETSFADMSLEPYESGTLNYIGAQYTVFDNFTNDNSYYVEDFNIKIADLHSHIEIGDEHFVPGVIPIHFMILSING